MKYIIAALLALFSSLAQAQTVTGSAVLSWTNPAGTLTGIEVHWATSPIPDEAACGAPCAGTRAAQATLSGTTTTTSQTIQVTNGQTLYFRLKATDANGKSQFSNQVSKLISVPVLPGAPTSFTVTISVTPVAP